MKYILTADNLNKNYRHSHALHNFSMHIPKGAIYGFVGENGAGKTTLIRTICGLQTPTSGTYSLYGVKNTDKRILEAQQRIGAVVESPAVYLDMNAENNLKHQYHVLGLPTYDGLKELLHLVGLEKNRQKESEELLPWHETEVRHRGSPGRQSGFPDPR